MIFEFEGVIGFALILLWVYCIFDVISTEEFLIRGLPKMVWLLIVIMLPDIGSIAWLLLGRPEFAGWRPGDTAGRPVRRVVGPEDRADYAAAPKTPDERLEAWEADLHRREQELRRQKPEDPPASPATW